MWSARCDMKCDKLSITFDWHSRHKDQIKVFLLTPIMSYHVTFIFFMRIYIQNKAIQPHTFTHKSIKFENFFFWWIFMLNKGTRIDGLMSFLTFFLLTLHLHQVAMLPSHVIHKSAIHSIIHSFTLLVIIVNL